MVFSTFSSITSECAIETRTSIFIIPKANVFNGLCLEKYQQSEPEFEGFVAGMNYGKHAEGLR